MRKITIDDRLENAASFGEMEIDLFLWKKTIERLRRDGLKVTEKFPSQRKGEVFCNISWKVARSGGEEGNFTQANYLHKMAIEAKNK